MTQKLKQKENKTNSQIILNYMKKHSLTQKQFAKRCNISITTLQKVLKGSADISMRVA